MRGFGLVCMIALCLLGCSNFDALPRPGQPYALILDPVESFTVVAVAYWTSAADGHTWIALRVRVDLARRERHKASGRLRQKRDSEACWLWS
jgi:hypothetical protein